MKQLRVVQQHIHSVDGAGAVAAYGDVLDTKVVKQGGNGFCTYELAVCFP